MILVCLMLFFLIILHEKGLKPHKCEVCGQQFRQKCVLKKHAVRHLSSSQFAAVRCQVCGIAFQFASELKRHMVKHERPGEKLFKCDYCEKRLASKSSLKLHTRLHTGERPFKCAYCPKTYATRHEWRGHEMNHTGLKPNKCDICGKTFSIPARLKAHKTVHNVAQTDSNSKAGAELPEDRINKPFKCEKCDRTFALELSLGLHQNMAHPEHSET